MNVKLNDPGEIKTQSKNHNLFYLISIFLLIVLTLVFLILFIFSLSKKKSLEDDKSELKASIANLSNINKDLKQENDILKKNLTETYFEWAMFGEKIINISYAEDGKIKNSFGKEGSNFNEVIGEINNNQDYISNEKNIYDLYIPYSATQKKNQYNKILLFIHGGNWVKRNKTDFDVHCRTYGSLGFITATMGYTLLIEKYEGYNIFRIIDEITATIKSIKNQLIERGFDGDKLEMAIAGYSAGAHLSLIYPYAFAKDSVIPIKFTINYSGPVALLGEYFIKLAKYNDTLDNIDRESIEKAKKDNKIVYMNDAIFQLYLVRYLNIFLGRKEDEEIDEMYDSEKKEIIKGEKYYELYKKVNYVLPIDYVDNTTVPTICVYGGNDDEVGVAQYAFLEDKFKEHGNEHLTLVYSRYAPHNPFELETQNGIYKAREMIYSVLDYAEKYFKKN